MINHYKNDHIDEDKNCNSHSNKVLITVKPIVVPPQSFLIIFQKRGDWTTGNKYKKIYKKFLNLKILI